MHPLEFDELMLDIADCDDQRDAVIMILSRFNVSQAEATRRCNFTGWQVATQTISNWVARQTVPPSRAVEQLADALERNSLVRQLHQLGFEHFNPRKYRLNTLRKMLALAQGWKPNPIEEHLSGKEIVLAKKTGLC